MTLKGILWDNDGVLVDTEQLFFSANKELLNSYGLDLSEDDFFNWYLIRNTGSWHLFEKLGMDQQQRHIIQQKRNAIYRRKLQEADNLELSGIQPLLQSLHGKLPMGIVTSAYRHHFDTIHANLKLRHYFDFVLTNEDYPGSKPSPVPYLTGLEKLAIAADQTVIVEDSPRGLEAARAAGIRCIVLRHQLCRDYPFDGAYRVVDTIEELGQTLQNLL